MVNNSNDSEKLHFIRKGYPGKNRELIVSFPV